MSKERDIEILEHKIADLDVKIANFEKQKITDKKIDNLKIQKLRYEDELSDLQYA
jgi:uncharacterized protein YdcH (DUF465 family)